MRALLAAAAMLSFAVLDPAAAQVRRGAKAAAAAENGGGLPALHTELQAETAARVNADAIEMANRTNADAALQEQITQLQATVADLQNPEAARPAVVGTVRIDGVQGEGKGDTSIYSFSFGAQNSGTVSGGGGGAGRTTFQDVTFTIMPGRTSPKLFELVATGKHVKDAVFTLPGRSDDGRPPLPPYREIRLQDLIFTSAQTGAVTVPESYSAAFGKICVKHFTESGSPTEFCHDVGQPRP
ncbi:MAG TPA: type VI secretion system tube protein Hcp [Anaeromyxobacter sp.]|nr:type VI secretion system tube protein Hcp [Anaeromyxobacter sp.]